VHRQAVELAREADREVGHVDALLDLAEALGQDLADLEADQRAEVVLVRRAARRRAGGRSRRAWGRAARASAETRLGPPAFATDPWSWRAVRAAGAALLDPAAGPALSARLAPLLAVAHALAARARELGVVRDDLPEDLVFALVSAADGALDTWLLEHPDAASDPAVARAAFATLRALVTGPAGSRRG
jgi:hypothetical protein